MNRQRATACEGPLRLEDDPDYSPDDEDDEPPYGEDDEDEDGDQDDDEDEEEVWQVSLTSGTELPRLAPISQLSQLETRPASPPDGK